MLKKGVDNLRRYFQRIVCNPVVVTNGTVRRVLSMLTGYYTDLEFIETVDSEVVKVLPLVSMTIEEENVKFNVQGEGWYYDRESADITIDGFGWTPLFKLSPSVHNLCMERPVDGSVFDPNNSSLPVVMNDEGL